MRHKLPGIVLFFVLSASYGQGGLQINQNGYFEMPGLDVTVFSDIYPEGHQTGVTIIQHGTRVAANGDLRLEPSPGQWSPVPKGGQLSIDTVAGTITQELWYPDSSKNRRGFNPVTYPDLTFSYRINVRAIGGSSFHISVDLDEPLPKEWVGKVGFNLELFPGELFGKSYLMDENPGMFETQPGGPLTLHYGEPLGQPMATGSTLVISPENDLQKITITSPSQPIELWDGRYNHNNGWYIVRSQIPAGATTNALEWTITPTVVPEWKYQPVLQVSQVGYHPDQKKILVIEKDKRDHQSEKVILYQVNGDSKKEVLSGKPEEWGEFLRYHYQRFDFSAIKIPGLYQLAYGDQQTHAFRIDPGIYKQHVWQPTLEYYLPVQMCHMRINEKYRVWHDACHLDDALMAPIDTNHFDGYLQGPSTLSSYDPLDPVPGINMGGWHDAGDYDLRVESQTGTVWMLSLMVEEFGLTHDATLIDPEKKIVEIHTPDGKSDAIQQIEHGLASILGGYRSLGRLYRGIICPTLRQYVMLGDAASMTDNLSFDPSLDSFAVHDGKSGIPDDRWVFTEDNPRRQLYVAAGLAAASRVLKIHNPTLSQEALQTALNLYRQSKTGERIAHSKILALSELILATGDQDLKKELIAMKGEIIETISRSGWAVGHVIHTINDKKFLSDIAMAVAQFQEKLRQEQEKDSPYGVPYQPNIWGAGWNIQRFGVEQYFFHKGWPALTTEDFFINSLNFVLGVHPGINTSSFASGVGARSVTVAYGVNRADWSYIPGGVASGTALIRPNLPELKIWPFFWQQTEYVMGGGATNYMFLVLAADHFFKKKQP